MQKYNHQLKKRKALQLPKMLLGNDIEALRGYYLCTLI
jgi:hypothetical protein